MKTTNNTKQAMALQEYVEKLKALGVFEAFERNLKSGTLDCTIQEFIDYWEFEVHMTFHRFISAAFYWNDTPEGFAFWSKIANS